MSTIDVFEEVTVREGEVSAACCKAVAVVESQETARNAE